ncbi:MAG: PAS domain-containing protein [Nitrosomonadales bacterium]|nr:PAS domain-containing protein [Nitrosomonadales bacterium]
MRDAQLIETTQELNRHIVNLLDSLSALYGLTDISIRNLDEPGLLRQALEALMSNQDMERCSIFLPDEADLLTVAAGLDWDEMLWNITRSDGEIPRQEHKEKPFKKTQFRLGEGILGRAAESGNIQHCRSCADDPQFKKIGVNGESVDEKPVQGSLLCVPIICEDRVLGVVNVYYPEPDFFNMWHERLLLLFCKMLGRLLISHRFVHQLDTLVDMQTQDLTKMNEHLRDEKKLLKENAASLRAILDNSPYLVWLKDAEGRYLKANKAFVDHARLEGIQQAVGKTDFDLWPKELAEKYRADDAEVMALRQQKHIEELAFDGSKEYWVETFKTPVIDENGNVLGTTGFARDITERREFEEELKRSNIELEQFSYAVSHDMRQPLRMISSYLQLIEISMADQLVGEKRDYFNFAVEGAKRIDRMLVALLEYSRVGRMGEPLTWIDSRTILDEALQFLQPAIDEAQAKVNITGDWPRILVSRDEILRLIQNLIGNAAKYRIAGRTPEIAVTGEMVKNEWHLCVADNGVGIIPGQIKRLFQIFQRLQSREAYEGTGIGLALCRKIVEHHKGRIWAESAGEGQGSKFYVALPIPQEKIISAQ